MITDHISKIISLMLSSDEAICPHPRSWGFPIICGGRHSSALRHAAAWPSGPKREPRVACRVEGVPAIAGLCPGPPPPLLPSLSTAAPSARMPARGDALGARNTPAVCPKPPYHQHDVSLSRATAHPEPSCKMRKTRALLDATRSGCRLIPR